MASSLPTTLPFDLTSLPPSLHAPPLPTLPFDLITEILCFLPVKYLLRLRCVCKSWNSLIIDPIFTKKHFRKSTTRSAYFVSYNRSPGSYNFISYPCNFLYTKITTRQEWFSYSSNNIVGHNHRINPYGIYHDEITPYGFAGSCNGILCIADNNDKGLVVLLNPFIRKFKELPLLENSQYARMTFGFGYDSCTDNYKVVAVMRYGKTEVKIHTLGTNCWKSIQEFPFGVVPIGQPGKFVSGTINWLTSVNPEQKGPRFIVSFDLGKESYQKVLPPKGVDACNFSALGVLRDCLCLTSRDDNSVVKDVWVMKEYGNRESWTKLFNVFYRGYPRNNNNNKFGKAIYIFENDQVLLKFPGYLKLKCIHPRNARIDTLTFQSNPEVCVESLISPCYGC